MPTERDLLFACLEHSGGHVYDRSPPYEDNSQDCVRFTFAVLTDLWPKLTQYHAELHLTDAAKPFSPVEAVEAAGLGIVSEEPIPGRWHLAQGWQSLEPLNRGHAWLWWEPPVPVAANSFIVQATTSLPWCEHRTLAEQTKRYPHTQWVALSLDLW